MSDEKEPTALERLRDAVGNGQESRLVYDVLLELSEGKASGASATSSRLEELQAQKAALLEAAEVRKLEAELANLQKKEDAAAAADKDGK